MLEAVTLYHPSSSETDFDDLKTELRHGYGMEHEKHYTMSTELPENIPSKIDPSEPFFVVTNSTLGEVYHSLDEGKKWAEKVDMDYVENALSRE